MSSIFEIASFIDVHTDRLEWHLSSPDKSFHQKIKKSVAFFLPQKHISKKHNLDFPNNVSDNLLKADKPRNSFEISPEKK